MAFSFLAFLRFHWFAGPGVNSLANCCDFMSLRVSLPKSQGYIKVWRPCAGNLALALFHSQTSRDLLLRRILHDIHFKALSPSLVQVSRNCAKSHYGVSLANISTAAVSIIPPLTSLIVVATLRQVLSLPMPKARPTTTSPTHKRLPLWLAASWRRRQRMDTLPALT